MLHKLNKCNSWEGGIDGWRKRKEGGGSHIINQENHLGRKGDVVWCHLRLDLRDEDEDDPE